ELMQFVPDRFVRVLSGHEENGRAQIWRERRRVDNELFKTFPAAGDDILIVQIAERLDQTRAQKCIARRFVFLWLPAKLVERGSQDRSRAGLKFFTDRITAEQSIDVIECVRDLIALGQ